MQVQLHNPACLKTFWWISKTCNCCYENSVGIIIGFTVWEHILHIKTYFYNWTPCKYTTTVNLQLTSERYPWCLAVRTVLHACGPGLVARQPTYLPGENWLLPALPATAAFGCHILPETLFIATLCSETKATIYILRHC